MTRAILYRVAVGVLLGFVLGGTPALAQIAVEPQSLSVTVEQYASESRTVTLRNAGSEPLTFCLSFDRPLQRSSSALSLDQRAGGTACGDYGEVLHRIDRDDVPASGWIPNGLTMTLDGRLFMSSFSGLDRTFELTLDLTYVRFFEHPVVDEMGARADTFGLTFASEGSVEGGSLWWLNVESGVGGQIFRVLLLEGDLDGNATGERIEIIHPDSSISELGASGPSYNEATDLFYFIGGEFRGEELVRSIWAVDRDGTVAEGYPRPQTAYPNYSIGRGVDAHGGEEGGAEGVRIETAIQTPPAYDLDRVVVLDRWGESLGAELETPAPEEILGPEASGIAGNPLRSRLDSNGVMYMAFTGFGNDMNGVLAVRPHPLPPSWLVVDAGQGPEAAWDGTLAPGESRTLLLTFRPGSRSVGEYTASLQVFEAESGEAVEVPLTLTVVPGVDAEEGAEPEGASGLEVYPNPARGAATVVLTLAEASEVRVVVYDVLGREVAVLAEGPLGAGEHALAFEVAGLPAGLYVVRAEGKGFTASRRVTVVR